MTFLSLRCSMTSPVTVAPSISGEPWGQIIPVAVEKDIGEHAFFTNFSIEKIDIDDVTFRDPVLSAASFDDCEGHDLGARKVTRLIPSGKNGKSAPLPLNQERDFTLCRSCFVVSQKFPARPAAKLLEFLRQLARDAELAFRHDLGTRSQRLVDPVGRFKKHRRLFSFRRCVQFALPASALHWQEAAIAKTGRAKIPSPPARSESPRHLE